jgi:hypothetical protein
MFIHELVAAPAQTERIMIANKIVKLLVKSIKEKNYAVSAICCSVLCCSDGVPPPLEFATAVSTAGVSTRKLLPVLSFLSFIQFSCCRCDVTMMFTGTIAHASIWPHIACSMLKRACLGKTNR